MTGRASEDTGIRIESIIKAGLTGPMAEALAMYYQVRLGHTLIVALTLSVLAAMYRQVILGQLFERHLL